MPTCQKKDQLCRCIDWPDEDFDVEIDHFIRNFEFLHVELEYASLDAREPVRVCRIGRCRVCGGRMCDGTTLPPEKTVRELMPTICLLAGLAFQQFGYPLPAGTSSFREVFPTLFHEEDQAFAKQWLSEPEGWHLMKMTGPFPKRNFVNCGESTPLPPVFKRSFSEKWRSAMSQPPSASPLDAGHRRTVNTMLLSEPGKVIRCADHLQVLLALPAETIDLILAAPGKQEFFQKGRPSDYLFRRTAVELLRVLKPGGVLVWHVPNERGEATFSTAQFRQVVYFQSIQLRLIDTILVEKERNTPPTPVRYGDAFESMYILAKGKPKTVHILKDKPNKWAGTKTWGCLTKREVNGTLTPKGRKTIQKFGARTNVWHYGTVLPMESELFGGKAVSLSERLAEDHIRTWSNEGDLVLAPFDKDGTVAKIAPLLERRWLSLQNAADCDGLRDNAG